MKQIGKTLATAGLAASMLAFAGAAAAALTQISTPDAAYTGGTTQIDLSGLANSSSVTSITDGTLTVGFSGTMNKRTAPGGGWATWGSPPDTEPTPTPVLYSGASSRAMSFSIDLTTFGVEIEPDPFSAHMFTMEFFDGASSLGSVSRSANGNAGARLLAATSDTPFDRVVVSSDQHWAAGRFRYDASAVPEPGTLGLLALGLVGFAASRRRTQ